MARFMDDWSQLIGALLIAVAFAAGIAILIPGSQASHVQEGTNYVAAR